MPNILLLHGINLNALGKRNSDYYGTLTLQAIENITVNEARHYGFEVLAYQSNHEGDLIDTLQRESPKCAGIIINPGAFAHYSYGLHDALLDTKLPAIEVHLSDIYQRESWRQKSVISPACVKVIVGRKERGYQEAVIALVEHLRSCH